MHLLITNARVLTLAGPVPKRGRAAMNDLGVLPSADVLIDNGQIAAVTPSSAPSLRHSATPSLHLDAAGRVLMPAFVDCHTHACWAGSRVDEWQQRLAGAAYLDILKAGGGIMSTVRATRAATQDQLTADLRRRLESMLALGSTTVEVKSGYGLTAEHELKMLRAIRAAATAFPGTVVPTALLGHALDPEAPDLVDRTINHTLAAVTDEFPTAAVDAFCEAGAWTRADTVRLLARARELNHPVRVHADQFTSAGMVEAAIELGALTADHLEASTPETLDRLAASTTIGVLLPICGFHVDGRYADGRRLIDSGGAVAIATNYNPGSAPCPGIPTAIALAVRHCGLSPAEAITAATTNAAAALALPDRGHITPGARADLILLNTDDERALAYEFGANPIAQVIAAGAPQSPGR